MDLDQISAKRAFRYLKRGVFSPDSIEHFTAGREKAIEAVTVLLSEVALGQNRHAFFEANYGFGKSHMLKVAQSLALKMGFAVAWVTINGSEHAFNHPTRYLHSILENIRVPRVDARGLSELCRHWLGNSERTALLNWASKLAPWETHLAVKHLSASDEEDREVYSDWYLAKLEGRDLQHKSGAYHFTEFFRPLETTVSLCRAVGYKGVVFLFDEIECIATQLSNFRSRLLSYQVMNTLIDGRRFPHAMFLFATTDFENEYQIGYRFVRKWTSGDIGVLPIGSITKTDNLNYLTRLREIHGVAYRWQPTGQIDDAFIESYADIAQKSGHSQRDIVKWFVEILEVAHQHRTFKPCM